MHVENYPGRLDVEHESVQFLRTTNLFSLAILVPKDREITGTSLTELKKVVMNASNLRVLNVQVPSVNLLDFISGNPPKVFQFETNDRFPPLEELRLCCNNHFFSIGSWMSWSACMDWTQLRLLDFGWTYQAFYMKDFCGKLPSLRTFRTGIYRTEQAQELDLFLTPLTRLEELYILSFIAKLNFPLALPSQRAHSLRRLGYHSPMIGGKILPDQFSSAEQLDELNEKYSNLVSLGIDMQSDPVWPIRIMSSLARFTHLRHLQVHHDMSAIKKALPQSISAARSLFASTRQEKIGVPLSTVDLTIRLNLDFSKIQDECSGDHCQLFTATIRCEAVQRDDGTEDTVVNIWDDCVERHALSKDWIRRLEGEYGQDQSL